MMFVVVC